MTSNLTLLDLLVKFFTLVIPAIISIIALRSGWTYTSERIFSQRSKLSKLSYELYKQCGDETLKKVSKEYGYAALTRDQNLTLEQRKVLLSSVDPVKDIDEYSKCSNYLLVNPNNVNGKFSWIKKRHKYKLYRGVIELILLIIYLLGCIMLTSPIVAPPFIDDSVMEKFSSLQLLKKVGIVSYIIIFGGFIAFMALNKISKLSMAVRLIKKNRTIRD
jgi:hypothetical protein